MSGQHLFFFANTSTTCMSFHPSIGSSHVFIFECATRDEDEDKKETSLRPRIVLRIQISISTNSHNCQFFFHTWHTKHFIFSRLVVNWIRQSSNLGGETLCSSIPSMRKSYETTDAVFVLTCCDVYTPWRMVQTQHWRIFAFPELRDDVTTARSCRRSRT